ncbi:XP_029634003.1uncharacterized protein LOC115209673 [Octopus vulgaris]|uniref:XP_029634003.1uncharacterized protein LOC115209673 n=1 Tax=Octopus vulgaris TaxID=6645 RepID=A0AA36AP28_OCTVU|nr:XP_029634003.1uncharacterized protein LOC115209673 [Octopus vulgaris]
MKLYSFYCYAVVNTVVLCNNRRLLACFVAASQAIAPPQLLDYEIGFGNISHGRVSFRSKYINQAGRIFNYRPAEPVIALTATNTVPELAVTKAAQIMIKMVKYMPVEVFQGLTRSLGAGLFSRTEGPTIYPEYENLADRPECYRKCSGACSITCTFDGRKWQHIAGISGTRSLCLDDIVLCNNKDPYGHKENIFSHEFAHLVMRYMPLAWRSKITNAYNQAKRYATWKLSTYAMATEWEYWAVASEAFFFDVTRTDVTGGLNMCGTNRLCPTEMAARDYIRRHDPQLFEVLSYAYTNSRPTIPGRLKVCV